MMLDNFRENEFILLGKAVSLENAIKYIYDMPIIRTHKIEPNLFDSGISGYHIILLEENDYNSNELYKLIYNVVHSCNDHLFTSVEIIPKRNDEEIKSRIKERLCISSDTLPIFESDCDKLRWTYDFYGVNECGEYPYIYSLFGVLLLLILSNGKLDFRLTKYCHNFYCPSNRNNCSEKCSNANCKREYRFYYKYSEICKFGTFLNFNETWQYNITKTKSYYSCEGNKFMKYEKIENEKEIKISEIVDPECLEILNTLKNQGITTNYNKTFEDEFSIIEDVYDDFENLCPNKLLDKWDTYTNIPDNWVEELKKYNDTNKNLVVDYSLAENFE